ncbi:hypothetical protein GEMRC1_010861 [Eukaryota sp. GEM-RC1]
MPVSTRYRKLQDDNKQVQRVDYSSMLSSSPEPEDKPSVKRRNTSTKPRKTTKKEEPVKEEEETTPLPVRFPNNILWLIAKHLATPNSFWIFEDMQRMICILNKMSTTATMQMAIYMCREIKEKRERCFASTAKDVFGVTEKYLKMLPCDYVVNPYNRRYAAGRLYDRQSIRKLARQLHGSEDQLRRKRALRRQKRRQRLQKK